MTLLLCSVFDIKVGAYMPPFCVRSKGEAIRSFEAAASDQQHMFYKYPGDYRLFIIGEYDDVTGRVRCGALGPEPLISADELSAQTQQTPPVLRAVGGASEDA